MKRFPVITTFYLINMLSRHSLPRVARVQVTYSILNKDSTMSFEHTLRLSETQSMSHPPTSAFEESINKIYSCQISAKTAVATHVFISAFIITSSVTIRPVFQTLSQTSIFALCIYVIYLSSLGGDSCLLFLFACPHDYII